MRIFVICTIVFWIYILTVCTRGKLYFLKFIVGSVGMFLFMMVLLQPYLITTLSKLVAAASGIAGDITGYYKSYYEYSLVLISNNNDAISMYIDYECSGVIEIMAFISLICFFPVYNVYEKIMYSIIGVMWIFIANLIRIFIICTIVHHYGNNMFYFAHTIFGRIVFYILSIILYFYVFTRSQIRKQKVGDISYGNNP
jgi:exosortase family protein XrtG